MGSIKSVVGAASVTVSFRVNQTDRQTDFHTMTVPVYSPNLEIVARTHEEANSWCGAMGSGASNGASAQKTADDPVANLSAETQKALHSLPEAAKSELLAAWKKIASKDGSKDEAAAATKMQAMQRGNATRKAADVSKWGRTVFKQFDTDKNGKLDNKELSRALKALPKVKPVSMPAGAKFMSVEEVRFGRLTAYLCYAVCPSNRLCLASSVSDR